MDRRSTGNNKKWWALVLLSITLILSMSTWFSASAVIPQLQNEWQISPTLSSLLTIAVILGFVVGAVFSSIINLSDRISTRTIILIGSVGAAVANFFIILAKSEVTGIVLRIFTGFFLAGVYPPAFKLLSTWFKKGRGLALGILAAALVIGNGMPHLVNGLGGLDWHVVIISTSIMTLVGGFIPLMAVKEGSFPFPEAVFDPSKVRTLYTNRGVRLAVIGYVGHMWELFAMYAWFSIFIADALILNNIQPVPMAALITFGVFVAGGLGSWIGGMLSDRWGRAKTTILMLGISGTCAVTIGLLTGLPLWILLTVGWIWGFAVVADSAQFSTLVTELSDQSYVGTALTLQLAIGYIVTIFTVWFIPFIQRSIGWRWTFAFLAPGPIMGILAMTRLIKVERNQK